MESRRQEEKEEHGQGQEHSDQADDPRALSAASTSGALETTS